ncbi:MAG: hypothetical protein EP338_05775 [Bacteroidetes bacterium]|nr:MAG: hypothetical protein EP338_05775 [Bacteroidota bacterium]
MKKYLTIFLMMLLGAGSVIAQYEDGMKAAMKQMDDAKTSEELMQASAFFERIANAEQSKWLPYYYAALCNNLAGWRDDQLDKDQLAGKSIQLLEKAEQLSPNNCELFCLRNLIFNSQMMVNPRNRWQTYGTKASEALESAKKADPNNPRPYFLEGQSKFNTPAMFGGGKKAAEPILQKAVELFGSYAPESDLHPNWGKSDAEELLNKCKK